MVHISSPERGKGTRNLALAMAIGGLLVAGCGNQAEIDYRSPSTVISRADIPDVLQVNPDTYILQLKQCDRYAEPGVGADGCILETKLVPKDVYESHQVGSVYIEPPR